MDKLFSNGRIQVLVLGRGWCWGGGERPVDKMLSVVLVLGGIGGAVGKMLSVVLVFAGELGGLDMGRH